MANCSRVIAAIVLMIQSLSALSLLPPDQAPLPPVRPQTYGTNQQPAPYYTGETLIFRGSQRFDGAPYNSPYPPYNGQPLTPVEPTPGAPFQGPPFNQPIPGAPFTGPPFDQEPPRFIFNPSNPGIPQSPNQPQIYPPPPQNPPAPQNPAAPRPVVPVPRPDMNPPQYPQTPQHPPHSPPNPPPHDGPQTPPFAPRGEEPAPKGPVIQQKPPQEPGLKDGAPSGSSRPAQAGASGPIVNADQDLNRKLDAHEVEVGKPFIFSKPSQFIIGTLAAMFGLCTLIKCYGKLCWDKSEGRAGGGDGSYDKGAPVTRQNGSIEADVDWSDHTQDEFEEDEDDEENVMTDVQQCRSKKAREMVPDDSATFSDQDRLGIEQSDVNILMEEEEDNNNDNIKEYPMTDDETRAIMREFKDTDDEYVD